MNDDEFLTAFDAGTLRSFSHEDHVRLVFAQLQRHDATTALENVRSGLSAMAARTGKPDSYHDTRTVAWFRLIAAVAESERREWSAEFFTEHPQFRRRSLLDDYYSREKLTSDEARIAFVGPDLRPLE